MGHKDDFANYCAELLAGAGSVRMRRMFGGHGLYADGLFIAIVSDELLYLKADGATRQQFESAGCQQFTYVAKGKTVALAYWSAPGDAMDSPALMRPWALLALQVAVRARKSPGLPRLGQR